MYICLLNCTYTHSFIFLYLFFYQNFTIKFDFKNPKFLFVNQVIMRSMRYDKRPRDEVVEMVNDPPKFMINYKTP